MSWFQSTKKNAAGTSRVSSKEILASFKEEQGDLLKLAHLITGDRRTAERSVRKAWEMAVHGPYPFPLRERLTEWVKWVAIKSAIACSLDEIVPCGPKYVSQTCIHSEHLLNGNDSKLREFRNFLSHSDPEVVIAELDPLARAVAILRTTARASILDCTLRLKLPPDTVLAANCRAMSWMEQKRNGADAEEASRAMRQEKS